MTCFIVHSRPVYTGLTVIQKCISTLKLRFLNAFLGTHVSYNGTTLKQIILRIKTKFPILNMFTIIFVLNLSACLLYFFKPNYLEQNLFPVSYCHLQLQWRNCFCYLLYIYNRLSIFLVLFS